MTQKAGCAFCEIIARRAPANVRYENDHVIVIDNKLRWTPVMLLVIPKCHMTQQELWRNGTLALLGQIAVEMGERFSPQGYRLLSNFGPDAMQSQEHGHVHVLGGMNLGPYA